MAWYRCALIVSDAIWISVALWLAPALRDTLEPRTPNVTGEHYEYLALLLVPALLVIFWLRGAYARRYLLGGPEEYGRVLSGSTYGTLMVVAVGYGAGSVFIVSRSWLLLFWLCTFVLVCSGRFLLRRAAHALRSRGLFTRRILIAGASDQGLSIAHQLHHPEQLGAHVVGLVDDFLPVGSVLRASSPPRADRDFVVLGHPRDVEELAAERGADMVVVISGALTWESQQHFARLCEMSSGLEIRLSPTRWDLSASRVEAAPLGFVPLLRLEPGRMTAVEQVICTLIDKVLATLLLLALAPALIWAIASARLRGVQNMLVRRAVVGQRGKTVELLLLHPDVSNQVMLHGAPALFAVLRGDFALAGPRPTPVDEQVAYGRSAGWLLTVKPGLTGPWRLVANSSPAERMLADVWWVRNWTLWQQIFVLFKTARLVGLHGRHTPAVGRWLIEMENTRSAEGSSRQASAGSMTPMLPTQRMHAASSESR